MSEATTEVAYAAGVRRTVRVERVTDPQGRTWTVAVVPVERAAVGGAHALAFHAVPRATKDIDGFIDPTRPNAKRAAAAIAFFGGEAPRYASAAQLLNPRSTVQLGVAPVRIDIVNRLEGVGRFAVAWKARVDAPFGVVPSVFTPM